MWQVNRKSGDGIGQSKQGCHRKLHMGHGVKNPLLSPRGQWWSEACNNFQDEGGGATFFRSTMPIAKAWLVAHTGRKESNCPTASQGPCPVLQAIRIQRANSKTCKHKQPSTWEERWRLLATLVWCEVAGPTMAKKFQRQQGCHYLLLIKRNRIFIAKHQGSGEFQG